MHKVEELSNSHWIVRLCSEKYYQITLNTLYSKYRFSRGLFKAYFYPLPWKLKTKLPLNKFGEKYSNLLEYFAELEAFFCSSDLVPNEPKFSFCFEYPKDFDSLKLLKSFAWEPMTVKVGSPALHHLNLHSAQVPALNVWVWSRRHFSAKLDALSKDAKLFMFNLLLHILCRLVRFFVQLA